MTDAEYEDLAGAVFEIIAPVVGTRRGQGNITYSSVCARLPGRWAKLEPHSQLLAGALGIISGRCRRAGLPALSALVVNADSGIPGKGYYKIAHPEVADVSASYVAWANEFKAVHQASYPQTWSEPWS